jgi:hypothetical protein
MCGVLQVASAEWKRANEMKVTPSIHDDDVHDDDVLGPYIHDDDILGWVCMCGVLQVGVIPYFLGLIYTTEGHSQRT